MSDFWPKVKHFKPWSDAFGDPSKMNRELILRLDDLRSYLNKPIIVTCGTQGKHSENSQHYLGRAVDVVFPEFHGHPCDLLFSIERFGFTGIGYYPDWKYKGQRIGGFHLDNRELPFDADNTLNYVSARWMGLSKSKYVDGVMTKYHQYIPLTHSNIIKHYSKGEEE